MLKSRIAPLAAGLVLGICLPVVPSVAGEDGLPTLVQALKNSGRNPAIIHSGRITALRRHTNQEMSETDFQRDVAAYIRHLEERLAIFSKSGDVENRDLTLESIENAESERRKVMEAMSDTTEKYEITFRGVDPFADVKQRIMSADAGPETEKLLAIGSHLSPSSSTYLRKDPYSSRISVDRSYMAFPFNEFGRARGQTLQLLTALLILGTNDHSDSGFTQEAVAKALGRLKAGGAGCSIQKRIDFEGGTVDVVEMTPQLVKGIGLHKTLIWIDPARGYICPKIEEYAGDRVFKSYESSGYFLDKNSGLWWPRSHVETEYDPDTGAVRSRDAYTMPPEGTAINVPVDDDEFAFRAKPGMQIADNQEGTGPTYHVVNDTSLRMKDGVLDLANNPDLVLPGRGGGPSVLESLKAMYPASKTDLSIIAATIAVIAVALIYARRRKSGSAAA